MKKFIAYAILALAALMPLQAFSTPQIAQPVVIFNFAPINSAKITTSGTSSSVTFTGITAQQRVTYVIANKGTKGAYIGWGVGSATAVASSGTPTASSHYLSAGAIETLDFTYASGAINTIAAIQGSDSADNGATILEISMGYGQ